MAFYLGSYLILQDEWDLLHDYDSWELPDTTAHSGHMSDTNNVEELLINPEDMDLLPEQIQFGSTQWSLDEGSDTDSWAEFYMADEAFYVRGFSPTSLWSEFYMADEAFYVRGFSATDYWSEFYVSDEAFYVRGFTPVNYWAEFYVADEAFYVRGFTPVNYWAEFYPSDFD
ncbi:MAG: hypothetical protein ACWGQW_23690 [bacterium]